MTLSKFLYSIIITVLVLFGIQIPTHWLYLILLATGFIGIISQHFAKLFIFLGVSYTILAVFYATLITLSSSLAHQCQQKIIAVFIITLFLSLLARTILASRRVQAVDGSHLNVFLVLAIIATYFQINRIFAYSPIALFFGVATLSYSILNVATSSYGIYNFKKKHILIALLIFVLLPFVNLIQFDTSKKTIGLIKYHSVWAKEDVQYTTDDWTLNSNYSYSEFSKLLSNKYKVLNINSEKDLNDILPFCNAVIIMTPTLPFTIKEKNTINNYLDLKGNIIIIGDHTDLYGHGRVINDLIQNTGVSINYDTHFAHDNWYGTIKFRNALFGNVRPLTASSLSIEKPAYVMAWSHNWVSEAANYNMPNFFGDLTWTGDDKIGDFPMAAIAKAGSGYVTIWTDSTMFSNFAIYQPRVLHTIDHLINNGKYLSFLTHIYSYLIFIFLALLFVGKYREILLILIFSFSILTGGLYLIYNVKNDDYYNPQTRIDIFCGEDIIRESPPDKDYLPFTLSNLYSNIPRYGLQPKWVSDYPPKDLSKQTSVWFTTYDNFIKRVNLNPKYIVIIDNSENISKLGYKISPVRTEPAFLDIAEGFNRRHWITSDAKHTIKTKESSIFTSYGVLDDRTIGNWWTTIDVSYYRKKMITSFIYWIKEGQEIISFQYPKAGIIKGNKNAILMQSGKDDELLRNVDFSFMESGKIKYIYLGGEMWGILNVENGKYFILGGPETSDNYYKYKNARYLILIK